MQKGSHNYLDKRRGLGRQCYDGLCDYTPCRCPKAYKSLIKRKYRRKDRERINEYLSENDDGRT